MRAANTAANTTAHIAAAIAGALVLAAGCGGPSAAANAPTIALAADVASVPADGISVVHLEATVGGAADGAVVAFALSGPGLLTRTNAFVVDGVAAVDLYAPFEDELTSQTADTTVGASITAGENVVASEAVVTFTVPQVGAPLLTARTRPDRVFAGGSDSIKLIVDGRRLDSTTLTLTADSDAAELPATIELDAEGHAELTIPAAPEPADVNVTISGGGAEPVDVALHFIEEGEAAFDVTGQFAKISYNSIKIGGLIFLDPDPQCGTTPAISLMNLVQTGDRLSMEMITCEMQMPEVKIVFVGASRTWVDPGFVDAVNRAAYDLGPIEVELDAGGGFSPETTDFPPLVLGAALADPRVDELPTSADDPRVRDDDGDGNPGMTIHNSIQGDMYAAYRSYFVRMDGQIESSDALTGTEEGRAENVLLNGNTGGIGPTITSYPSPFYMQRVDGRNGAPNIAGRDGDPSSISCADVLAYAAELEALHPGPDVPNNCAGM